MASKKEISRVTIAEGTELIAYGEPGGNLLTFVVELASGPKYTIASADAQVLLAMKSARGDEK